jgi:hypothetical protein
MASLPRASSTRVLEPVDRISEILFGLIMVLTFTGSLSVAEAGRDDVRAMLVGALGCNLAWGAIDGIFYLMGCLAERSRNLATFRRIRAAERPEEARQLVADALPPLVASLMTPPEIDALRERIGLADEPAAADRLQREDYAGALGVFLLVFLSTFPVAVPFMVMPAAQPALRASNAIAVFLLFLTGHRYGRLTGRSPMWVGCGMVVLGLVLVGLTIALGG